MPRTKHPYHETLNEKIERWASLAVTDGDQPQQLALISLLHEFSRRIGNHEDIEGLVNYAMYCAFRVTDCLFDEAIACTVSMFEEDRAVEFTSRRRPAKGMEVSDATN